MAFSTNYETRDILPEGEYECMILSAFLNATQGGTQYFSIKMVIRNDVPQNHQNRFIYHAIWQRKPEKQTEEDKMVDGFSFKQLMNLSRAAGIPKGKSYNTLDDLGADLKGKCIRVTIGHNEFNGETREQVKWSNLTKFPSCKHKMPVTNAEPALKVQEVSESSIDDDDLPFD